MYNLNLKTEQFLSAGIVWAPYPHWKTLRSFTISTLREEGMGKAAIEPKILEEAHYYICHFLEPNLGKPIDISLSIPQATSNIISQMLFSKRFDYEDKNFSEMIDAFEDLLTLNTKVAMLEYLPFGSYLIKSTLAREKHIAHTMVKPTLRSYIDEHKKSLDKENPRDVTDRYLIHSQMSGEHSTCFSGESALKVVF